MSSVEKPITLMLQMLVLQEVAACHNISPCTNYLGKSVSGVLGGALINIGVNSISLLLIILILSIQLTD